MALVTGPLLSLDASGSVAGSLVFAKWKGRPYVRQLVTPSNPKSANQRATRAMFKFLAQAWAGLSGAEQADWQTLADATTVSPFNAFVGYNMDRWTQFETPYDSPDPTAGAVPVLGALSVTGAIRQAQIAQTITTANQIWGLIIYRSEQNLVTPTKSDVIAVVEYDGSPVEYLDTPVTPGFWYYSTAGFDQEGEASAPHAWVGDTVL